MGKSEGIRERRDSVSRAKKSVMPVRQRWVKETSSRDKGRKALRGAATRKEDERIGM